MVIKPNAIWRRTVRVHLRVPLADLVEGDAILGLHDRTGVSRPEDGDEPD